MNNTFKKLIDEGIQPSEKLIVRINSSISSLKLMGNIVDLFSIKYITSSVQILDPNKKKENENPDKTN